MDQNQEKKILSVSDKLSFEAAALILLGPVPAKAKMVTIHYVTSDKMLHGKVGKIGVAGLLRYIKYRNPTPDHLIGYIWVEWRMPDENKEELFSSIHG